MLTNFDMSFAFFITWLRQRWRTGNPKSASVAVPLAAVGVDGVMLIFSGKCPANCLH